MTGEFETWPATPVERVAQEAVWSAPNSIRLASSMQEAAGVGQPFDEFKIDQALDLCRAKKQNR